MQLLNDLCGNELWKNAALFTFHLREMTKLNRRLSGIFATQHVVKCVPDYHQIWFKLSDTSASPVRLGFISPPLRGGILSSSDLPVSRIVQTWQVFRLHWNLANAMTQIWAFPIKYNSRMCRLCSTFSNTVLH